MIISLALAIILAVIFMLITPSVFLILFYNKTYLKWIILGFFMLYFGLLCIGVFGKIDIDAQSVGITFENNGPWFRVSNFSWYSFDITNVLINLFMLFPLGAIFLGLKQRKPLMKTILLAFCLSVFIEFMQFVLPINRTVEVTDILFNTISGIIGFIFFWLILKLFKKNNPKSYPEPE